MKFDIDSNKVCFLSPHSDDTFLELYFTIANRVLPGEYFLCTVFSESNYVDISQKDLFLEDTITNIRVAEDLAMARKLGMKYFTINEPDCLMRYGLVFFDDCLLDEELIVKISERICILVKEQGIDYIIAPYPWGNKQHYDHRVLCKVAKRVAEIEKVNLLWTNDIPYSSIPKEIIKKCIWSKILTDSDVLEKVSKLDYFYPSQTCEYYKDAIRNKEENLVVL